MQLPTELKKAISNLTDAEKDKLLFRLLKKDSVLCQRLQYELVEKGDTLQERREQLIAAINRQAAENPYSPGYLMMDMRALNAEITRHVKYTKDNEGEIQLTLFLLHRFLEAHHAFIVAHLYRAQTLQDYLIKRMQFVLQKLSKVHEDLNIEYAEDVNYVLQQLHEHIAPPQAAKAKLPKQWPA